MEKEQLMQHINAAISLETDVATQESLISVYNQTSLARKPQLSLQKEPIQPSRPTEVEYHGDFSKNSTDGASYAFAFSFFFFIIGFILLVAVPSAWYIGFLFMLPGIPLLIPHFRKKKAASNSNVAALDRYQKAMTQYNNTLDNVRKANSSATSLYNSNLSIWQKNTNENLAVLKKKLAETRSLLDQLYSKDFIYGKYRNLPALTSIYEYFVTGRCSELAGPHGAYNLYEDEVRKDTVISQLSTVIDNLEQIKQNQYLLYQQAKQIKNETVLINQELRQIKGYTIQLAQLSELQTYYSALTARNTQISATMHLING